jgi:hypothetical protein
MIDWIDEIDWIGWFRRRQFIEKDPTTTWPPRKT